MSHKIAWTDDPSKNLWVGNVKPNVTEEEITDLFKPFGAIRTVVLIKERKCAFVNYEEVNSVISQTCIFF